MKKKIIARCWEKSHLNVAEVSEKLHSKYIQKMEKGILVCQECGSRLCPLYSPEIMFNSKAYACSDGHLNTLFAFKDGKINITWGSSFEDSNCVTGTDQDVESFVKNGHITCHHSLNGVKCSKEMQPLDDLVLKAPTMQQAKTKTRVGDLWDKNGIESVKPSHYTNDGQFVQSKTDAANKLRLEKMQRERAVSNHPGKKITRKNVEGI